MPPSSTRLTTAAPMSLAERTLLTYQAISQSDNIVLFLEVAAGTPTADAVIIGANDAFRRASGYSNDQLLGRGPEDLFQSASGINDFRDAIRNGHSLRTELACSRADGTTFVLGLHLMPASPRSAGQNCFVVLGRDITEVLQVRRLQDAIQRLLAKVFVSVDNAMSIVDSAGGMVMTNPAFDRLLGYKPNELAGRQTMEMIAAGSRDSVAASIKQQLQDERDLTYNAPVLHANGSELMVRVTSVLVAIDKKQFRILTLYPSDETLATATRSESAGRINLIGLDDVRTALGDRWAATAARAMATAEAVLKRRCGPQDSYSRVDDTSFVVCFGSLGVQEASFRAAMIGREIRDRLIGQGDHPDTSFVRAIAATVRLPAQDYASAGVLHAALTDGLDKQLARLEEEATQTLRAGWAGAVCELDSVLGRDPKAIVANQVSLPRELKQRLLSSLSVLPRKESEAFDLDALLLGLAAQQVVSGMARGVTTPLLVNVRFDVFLSPAATERFLVTCRRIDPRISSRLILMLSAMPQGLPKSRLLACVARLRPFCCGLGYHANDLAAAEALDLSNSFNPILALPFGALAPGQADRIKQMIAALRVRQVKVLIHQVQSEREAAVARSLGADMIGLLRSGSEDGGHTSGRAPE